MRKFSYERILLHGGSAWAYASHSMPDARCYRLQGHHDPGYPTEGGDVDGVTFIVELEPGATRSVPSGVFRGAPGLEVQVECGATVSAGYPLATMSDGRVKQRLSDEVAVLRALENGSAGSLIWAVFLSGRS